MIRKFGNKYFFLGSEAPRIKSTKTFLDLIINIYVSFRQVDLPSLRDENNLK